MRFMNRIYYGKLFTSYQNTTRPTGLDFLSGFRRNPGGSTRKGGEKSMSIKINNADKKKAQAEVGAEKGLSIQEPHDLAKPQRDTKFAHNSAKLLVDIIKKNGWSRRLGGQSEHIQYEGWQAAGKYYGYAVKTY